MTEEPKEPIARGAGEAEAEEILEGDYFTIKEVAEKLKFSTTWVTRLCERGRIRAFKPLGGRWRIPKSELNRMTTEGTPPLPRERPIPKATEITVPAEKIEKVKPSDEPKPGEPPKKNDWFPLPFPLK